MSIHRSTLGYILLSLTTIACRGPAPAEKKPTVPRQRPSAVTLPAEPAPVAATGMTIFDLPVLLASAKAAGKAFPANQRALLEGWVEEKTRSYLQKGYLVKAYEVWANYAEALTPGLQGPRMIPLTHMLLRHFLKQGGITESLHAAMFLHDFGEKNQESVERRLLAWIGEMDKLESADCLAPAQKPGAEVDARCQKQLSGDKMFQKIMHRYERPRIRHAYWKYLTVVYGLKAASPAAVKLADLAHLPLFARKLVVIRVAGLLLFEPKGMEALARFIAEPGFGTMAPWLKTTLERLTRTDGAISSWDVVKTFFSVRMGGAFSLQVCNVAALRFGEVPWVAFCRGQHAMSLSDSVTGRHLMLKALAGNIMLKQAWDGVFSLSLKRFYHFIEREHLGAARVEARFLAAFHEQSKKVWSKGDFRFSLSTISMALADLFLIRGKVKAAREELTRTLAKAPSAGILNSLIRIAYWSGNYPRVLELFEKYKELPEDKGYNVYLFMKMARIHAFTREKLGSPRHARVIRYRTIEYYLKIFRNLADRDLQAELLVEAARIYLDDGKVDLAVQLFQFAMDRTESCGTYRTILQQYVMYGMIDQATNVYNSLMGLTSCAENRQVYGSLWILLLAKRKHANPDTVQTAVDFLKEFKGEPWLVALSRFVLGKITFEQLMSKAGHLGQKAEGWFYGGYLRWARGDITGAKELFNKVLGTKIFIYSEFEMAHYLLGRFQKKTDAKDAGKTSI